MTSKERVRSAIAHKRPDRVPAAFEAVSIVTGRLLKAYGLADEAGLYEKFEIDVVPIRPKYIGPPLPTRYNEKGELVTKSYWGWEDTYHKTDIDCYPTTSYYPLNHLKTPEEIEAYPWPSPDWFDYEDVKRQCAAAGDKALIFGHEGPFQIVTFLKSMELFFLDMAMDPEIAHRILKKMNDFEMEYYERLFIAADGQLDILRPHDDYGTQISLMFSVDMWREFFRENTKKLADLAHRYGAFYQQHSCGAVEPLIPEFISCGVDVLEPLQKVSGLEPENLIGKYKGRICFHGGIDTQDLLPHGAAEAVRSEAEHYMRVLAQDGGYILMSSQALEPDVPIENIEALFTAPRD